MLNFEGRVCAETGYMCIYAGLVCAGKEFTPFSGRGNGTESFERDYFVRDFTCITSTPGVHLS